MDLLAELVYVLSLHFPKDFDDVLPITSKMRRLFDLVSQGNIQSDEEAASIIYQSSPKDKKYLMLKRNLINRLVDLLREATPTQEVVTYEDERSYCQQKLMVSERLLQQNVYHNAERIVSKNLQRAEKYHLVDIELACALQMRSIASLKGYNSQVELWQHAVVKLQKKLNNEQQALGYVQIVKAKTKFFLSYQDAFVEEIRYYLSTMPAVDGLKDKSAFTQLYYWRLRVELHRYKPDLDLWKQAIHHLQLLFNQHAFLLTDFWVLDLYLCYIKYHKTTGAHLAVKSFIDKGLAITEYAAFNRFEFMECLFDWNLRQLEYTEAYHIISEVQSTAQFEQLDPIDKASWGIRGLFLYYITANTPNEGRPQFPLFEQPSKIREFLSVKQPVSSDKRGYNLHLVMLRFFFLLVFDPQAELSSEGNKMMVYYQRHIKLIEHTRTGVFFKSLAKAAINNMKLPYLLKREKKLFDRLEVAQKEVGLDECELIPYEVLWGDLKARFAREQW